MSDPERVFVTHDMRGLTERAGRDPLAPLRARAACTVWSDARRPDARALRAGLRGHAALVCLLTDRIDASVIEAADVLRVISTVSVGFDHIDLAAASARGIAVGNTPGVLTETTAELALALLLATTRRVAEADADVRAGRWTRERRWELDGYLGRDLAGATLGIVGLGAVGRAVAARAAAFGMRIVGWSRSDRAVPGVERVPFDTLLAESDFVSLHVASTPETRGLIDASALARMKPGAVLVNTARGDVASESDLVAALASGHLGGAGLDVFADEPIGADHPLTRFQNVVLTPHVGSASVVTRLRMADLAVANVLAVLDGGLPVHCANREALVGRGGRAVP
jgi:glyoxylate reductase